VKKAAAKGKSRRILGYWVVEKREHFWQKVLQKYTDAKRQKKGGLEEFFQN
jgi:hypothetical protein